MQCVQWSPILSYDPQPATPVRILRGLPLEEHQRCSSKCASVAAGGHPSHCSSRAILWRSAPGPKQFRSRSHASWQTLPGASGACLRSDPGGHCCGGEWVGSSPIQSRQAIARSAARCADHGGPASQLQRGRARARTIATDRPPGSTRAGACTGRAALRTNQLRGHAYA